MSSHTAAELPPVDPEKGGLDHFLWRISLDRRAHKLAAVKAAAFSPTKDSEKGPAAGKGAAPSKPPAKPKKKIPKWVQFRVWFNTYRWVVQMTDGPQTAHSETRSRKLFILALTINMIGLGLAASGIWQYGNTYSGAIVTANLNIAVLVRNELFGRFLYLVVNTLFAKVSHFGNPRARFMN